MFDDVTEIVFYVVVGGGGDFWEIQILFLTKKT